MNAASAVASGRGKLQVLTADEREMGGMGEMGGKLVGRVVRCGCFSLTQAWVK